MFLSIIIPTYEYDCSFLCECLSIQAQKLQQKIKDFKYEIIVGDDGSHPKVQRKLSKTLFKIPSSYFFSYSENKGKATLSNQLFRKAKGEFILWIDSDAKICSEDFLFTYYQNRNQADIICGSIKNISKKQNKEGCELRYKYEKHAESKRSVSHKNKYPYLNFTTFNVLIHHKVLSKVPFDERCKEYGYEDALWGILLKEKGYSILHIDNPLIHEGIDSNTSFLHKTEASLRTLKKLGNPMQQFAGPSKTYNVIKRFHGHKIIIFLFIKFRKKIKSNLLSKKPSLLLFQLYKLGYYSYIMNNHIQE